MLQAALDQPELVCSVVIFEPALETVLEGRPEYEPTLAAWGEGWGPVVEASRRGAEDEAIRLALELVFGLPAGGFEALPEGARSTFFDNAHTVSKLFEASPPTPMTCDDLGRITAPVLILWGSQTLPFFEAAAKEVATCLPNAALEELAGVGHGAPLQTPDLVVEKTLAFIDSADGS